MTLVITNIYQKLDDIFHQYADRRSDHLPFMKSNFEVLGLLAAYLAFVKIIGPKIMQNRKPFNLKTAMALYNLIQVGINLYILIEAIIVIHNIADWNFRCQNVDYSTDKNALMALKINYYFFVLKAFDFVDSIFFVLRKKWNQLSFLHVYHHVIICYCVWITAKYFPGGHGSLLGLVNAFVHALMYAYYFAVIYKPELRESYWKKFLTQLQMVQFLYLAVHFASPILFPVPGCSYSRLCMWLGCTQNIFMLYLFGNFYIKTYITAKAKVEIKYK